MMRTLVPTLGALLLIASQAAGTDQDLCYSMRLAGSSGAVDYEFKPVTGFPSSHAVVTNQFCGRTFEAGEAIPGGNTAWGGNPGSSATQCHSEINSGAFFYAYGKPNSSSSNTGFEQADAVIVYFVVDDAGVMSLVLTFDSVHDGSGGEVYMSIDAPDLVGQDITFGLRDDSHEPTCGGSMCQWDSATGAMTNMRWVWASCCTDGMALTNLPTDGESIPFSFNTGTTGISTFKIAQWNNDTLTPDFIDLDADLVLSSGFVVRAQTCGAFCRTKTSCGECSLDGNCQWCEGTGSCVSNNQAAAQTCPDGGGFNAGTQCCAVCTAHESCVECGGAPGCGWDFASSVCLSAKYDGIDTVNETVTCADPEPQFLATTVAQCATCPGAIYNGTDLVDWCSSNGDCDWPARRCDCDYGWFGAACSDECPGGAANPCNGHGACNGGFCFCECGWSGAACDEEGCPCGSNSSTVPADRCAVGSCNEVCGVRFADQTCSGSEVVGTPHANESCACLVGWWGDDCTNPCPGVNSDGTGVVCGGHGTCDAQGQCECTDCHSPDPTALGNAAGTCVADPALVCNNFGSSQCIYTEQGAANQSSAVQCVCNGVWTGPSCDTCPCPGDVSCNSISGECEFTQCTPRQYTASPGSLSNDTVCAPVTACTEAQWETAAPTSTSDRVCRNTSAECALPPQWQSAAPTTTSDRECRSVSNCAADDAYETAPATAITDSVCVALTGCTAMQFETGAPTATSDRTCANLTACTPDEYESTPASYNSDLLCLNLTVCAEVGVEWQSSSPTALSDRGCSAVRGPCDPDLTLDLAETAAPTATSNRGCTAVDDCAGAPCLNGATCADGVHRFSCACAEYYIGPNCSIFDSCVASPCPDPATCTATAIGAVCGCANGQFGKCCDQSAPPVPDDTGEVCMTVDEAEQVLNSRSEDAEASTSAGSGILVGIVACLSMMIFVAAILVARRRKEEKEVPEDGELDDVGAGTGLNPMFIGQGPGKATMLGGGDGTMAADGSTLAARGGAATEHVSSGIAYDMCHGGQGSEYVAIDANARQSTDGGTLAARGAAVDTTYDVGVAGAEAVYDNGAARAEFADAVYDNGAARAEYDVGSARTEAVYDSGAAEDPNIYAMAQSNDATAPSYSLGAAVAQSDGIYNNRQQVEAIYGLGARGRDEAVYGLRRFSGEAGDPIYGIKDLGANRARGSEGDTYANTADVADPTYGLAGDVVSPGKDASRPSYETATKSEDTYANSATTSAKPTYEIAAPNGAPAMQTYEIAAPDGVYGLAADLGIGQSGDAGATTSTEDIYNNVELMAEPVSFEDPNFLPMDSDTLLRNAGVDGTLTRTTPSAHPMTRRSSGLELEPGADVVVARRGLPVTDSDGDSEPEAGGDTFGGAPRMRVHSTHDETRGHRNSVV